MKKDHRLLIPFALFLIALIALSWQSLIVSHYIYSSVLDHNWEGFVALYGVKPPSNPPNTICFDYCAPKLPFLAGWTGISCFIAGLISLGVIWWKPKA